MEIKSAAIHILMTAGYLYAARSLLQIARREPVIEALSLLF